MTAAPQTAERPLVTFALFAFNQERYIREAIEGAFAQTYQPLEIILSDDCSTDHTFEIIEEMAAGYQGSHFVKARRSLVNSGTLNHLLDVTQESHGCLIVLAAGDDISKPERVQELVNIWALTRASGICSKFDIIDEDGGVVQRDCIFRGSRGITICFRHATQAGFIHGATSAYDRGLLCRIPRSTSPIYSEDEVLSFLILLTNQQVAFVGRSLVLYRSHQEAASSLLLGENLHSIQRLRKKISRGRLSKLAVIEYCEKFLQYEYIMATDSEKIADARRMFSIQRATFFGLFRERLKALGRVRRLVEARYILLRIFGIEFLAITRIMIRELRARQRSVIRIAGLSPRGRIEAAQNPQEIHRE